jgi:integrase
MTFNDLADFYAKHYLRPAEFVNGRKVAGLRDWKHPRAFIQTFRETFGKRNLRSITPEDIRNFRAMRLQTPTMHGRQRSITTVNRELTCLRRLFTIACREGWIHRSPFTDCDTLICVAAERKRERILTREEEERLLTACTGPRKHLRAILLCALDTGMRMGELLKLRWEGVDLDSRLVSTGKSFSVTSNVSAN